MVTGSIADNPEQTYYGSLLGANIYYVSPSLVPDGANYGSWNSQSGTWGIQEAINAAAANPLGGTVVLQSSKGPFQSSAARPMNGIILLPNVKLTNDNTSMKTSSLTQADIIVESHFTPIAAFPANAHGSGDPAGPPTVIATLGPNFVGHNLASGYYIGNLVILIQAGVTTDGIHLTNVNTMSIGSVLVHGASGTSTQSAYAASYTQSGGIVFDQYDWPQSPQPGVVFADSLTAETSVGGLCSGVVILGQVTFQITKIQTTHNTQHGTVINSCAGIYINQLVSNNNTLDGLLIADTDGNPSTNVQVIGLDARLNGTDIVFFPTQATSTNNQIVGGTAGTYNIGAAAFGTTFAHPGLQLGYIQGITNMGVFSVANGPAAGGSSGTPSAANTYTYTTQLFASAGTGITAINVGYPAPPFPNSTVTYVNTYNATMTVVISGGTFTAVFVNGVSQGVGGTYSVPSGQTISVTYSVLPTWTWTYPAFSQASGAVPAGTYVFVPPGGTFTWVGTTVPTFVWAPHAPAPSTVVATYNLFPFSVCLYFQGGTNITDVYLDGTNAGHKITTQAAAALPALAVTLGPGEFYAIGYTGTVPSLYSIQAAW